MLRHRLFLRTTAAAIMLASLMPMAAQAAPDRPHLGINHEIVGFFGFGPDQANNPTDPQPVAEPSHAGLTPREISPALLTELDATLPQLPVVTAASPPSVETP